MRQERERRENEAGERRGMRRKRNETMPKQASKGEYTLPVGECG